jgi:hypothetical protein
LILGGAPHAQDLFVEFARPSPDVGFFLGCLVCSLSGPTHYAGRLPLDTDRLFRDFAGTRETANCAGVPHYLDNLGSAITGTTNFRCSLARDLAISFKSTSLVPNRGHPGYQFWLMVIAGLVILSGAAF